MTFEFGVVNYNGGPELSTCIGSILALRDPPPRVLVFDNASTDGSADAAERTYPGINVVRSRQNLGYAGALNRMLEQMTADVVVLCNMDIRFDPNWIRAVSQALDRHSWADSVASLVLEMGDPPVVNSAGIRLYRDLHPQNVGSGQPASGATFAPGEVLGSYGAAMCFRRASIEGVSFDADYFLFFEETDFHLRFALLGGRTLFVPEAMVYHHRSLTTRRYSPLKLYYGERNRLTTVFKLLPVWYWPLTLAYSIRRLAIFRRQAPRVREEAPQAVPGPVAIVWTILRAWGAAVLRMPGTLRKRRTFWSSTSATPRDALRLQERYALRDTELSLR